MEERKGDQKDTADWNRFRHHRDRHLGIAISNEYYQQAPMFFTREGSQLNLIGNYRGSSAFMICNGPSLIANGYDLSLLKKPGVMTYGMNNGAKTFRPTFWTCVDNPERFIKSIWLDPSITKFVPHAHAEKALFDNEKWQPLMKRDNLTGELRPWLVGDCPNMVYFHRNEKFVPQQFLFEDTINWGNHKSFGGSRSVMLPVLRILFLLGFRKVYLLGVDFNMSATYTYHFDEQRDKGAVKGNLKTYNRLIQEYLPSLKEEFDREKFEVYNLNPNSGLKCFPFKDYKEAIEEATSGLGDIENERTWGLYTNVDERPKMAKEAKVSAKPYLTNIVKSSKTCAETDTKEAQVVKMNVAQKEEPKTEMKNNVKKVDTSGIIIPSQFIVK